MLGTPELDAFVSRSFTGIVTTIRKDGSPVSSMINYGRLGDTLCFSTTLDRFKGRSLQRDPRLSLCVINDREPNSYVTVEGTVVIHRDNPKDLQERILAFWAGFVDRHPKSPSAFFGRDTIGKMWSQPGRVIIEVRATRVSGYLL